MLAPALAVEPTPLTGSLPAVVVAGAGAGWDEDVVVGLLNKLGVGAAAVVPGAEEVAVVPGVVVAVGLTALKAENEAPPAGAAAGVDDTAEDVAPPILGKGDFWGVLDVAAEVPNRDWGALVVPGVAEGPPSENADFGAESPPEEGLLKRDVACGV